MIQNRLEMARHGAMTVRRQRTAPKCRARLAGGLDRPNLGFGIPRRNHEMMHATCQKTPMTGDKRSGQLLLPPFDRRQQDPTRED